jgi:hypothetical protein
LASAFISHRGADSVEAGRLGAALADAGHEVRLDTWEIRVGDSIIGWMNEALRSSLFLILCYSKHGTEAPWMSREWQSGLALQLDGHGIKLLPARLTGGDPPAILADIKYADLTRDWDRGISELLRVME